MQHPAQCKLTALANRTVVEHHLQLNGIKHARDAAQHCNPVPTRPAIVWL
jgi:hypothetical protein